MMFSATNAIHLIALWAHKYLELQMTNVVLRNPIVGRSCKTPYFLLSFLNLPLYGLHVKLGIRLVDTRAKVDYTIHFCMSQSINLAPPIMAMSPNSN